MPAFRPGPRALAMAGALACIVAAAPAARAEGCDDKNNASGEKKNNFHVEMRNGQKVHVIDTVILPKTE